MDSEPPFGDDRDSRRLERILPELLKRVVDVGLGKLNEGRGDVKAFVNDMKLPREVSTVIAAQLNATKDALAASVASEVRRFLEHTDFRDMLSGLTLEVKTQVRFVPTESDNPPEAASAPTPSEPSPQSESAHRDASPGEGD